MFVLFEKMATALIVLVLVGDRVTFNSMFTVVFEIVNSLEARKAGSLGRADVKFHSSSVVVSTGFDDFGAGGGVLKELEMGLED